MDGRLGLESLAVEQTTGTLFDEGSEALPEVWKSLRTGHRFKIRKKGDYLYFDLIPNADQEEQRVPRSFGVQE